MTTLAMYRTFVSNYAVAALVSVALSSAAIAQQAVTVSGYVSSHGAPLAGAHVRVDELKIDRKTDASGRYSFVVPSASVRGQRVRLVATMLDRHVRYASKSATIELIGVPVTQDFDLALLEEGQEIAAADLPAQPSEQRVTIANVAVDSGLGEVGAATDLASLLVGRFAGLNVVPASVPGGSAQLTFRGPRSALGPNQPLFVVDGLPVSNTVFTSAAQRFGLGGFDHGSAVSDIDVANVASVQLMEAAEGAAVFGARGANGVIVVTTKAGTGGPHFGISVDQTASSESYGRLPSFQNRYGQGLNGKFEFFDGRGGGINDAVDENWGPALDGRPLPQASYRESGRGDVRLWIARPDNLEDYFVSGNTTKTTASIQGQTDAVSFRIFGGNRNTTGITPGNHLLRRNATAQLTLHPVSRLALSLAGIAAETRNEDAPGSGFAEGNPAFQFLRMGRQVDTDSLEEHQLDASHHQISWNYVSHNNPFFLSQRGDEYSRRFHTGGSGSATYAFTPGLSATARGGGDYVRDGRLFRIPTGWMGGFPFYAGDGDFSRGGSEGDETSVQETNAMVRLDGRRKLVNGAVWTLSGGADLSNTQQRIRIAGVDSAANVPSAGAPDSARIPAPATWDARASTHAIFGETGMTFSNSASIQAVVRNEWVSLVPNRTSMSILPSIRASFDAMKGAPSLASKRIFSQAVLHASWWRAAPELTPYTLQSMYAGRTPTGSIAPVGRALVVTDPDISPEITNGFEAGADLGFRRNSVGLGFDFYHEQTSDVILPVTNSTGLIVATNAGTMSNKGIEATVSTRIGDAERGFGWSVRANAAKNWNTVEQLYGSTSAIPLGPEQWGLSVQARTGQPLGALMGYRFLRASNGELILRNGLPVPDSISGLQQLGVGQPKFTLGLESTLQYRWVSVTALADAHLGGQVFSATNLWGSYAGTLASTAFRPDSGLLIAGVDAATGGSNATHVSTQDYFHALAAIQEPWIYSASYLKLRTLRFSVAIPTTAVTLPFESIRVSFVGNNLYTWAKAPNIDPDAVFSPYQLPGVEMGQLPTTKSIGVQVTVVP